MADVEIVVEASLGDSLAKLGLAKEAVDELGNSSGTTGGKISRFNRAMDDSTIASAKAGETILKTDHLIRDAENTINDVTNALDGGGGSGAGGGLTAAFGGFGNILSTNIPLLFGFSAPLAALPAVAFAAVAALVALADTIGTLVAITADFVAPLGLVAGLLGSLGLGFVFAAKRAADGGGKLSEFSDKLATLHSMFSKTTDILAHAFLPYLDQLAGAAQKALLFIDKLAREPLDKAMRDMATQGVQMLNSFVQQVAHVLGHPIRLAFRIAFGDGKGGNEFASAVAGWWHQLTGFLFGYTRTHRMNLPLEKQFAPLTKTHVDGIFQPLIDWFNRHHFTRQGIEIGHSMLQGFVGSGATQKMSSFFVAVMEDAFKTTARGLLNAMEAPFAWILSETQKVGTEFDSWLLAKGVAAFKGIGAAAVAAFNLFQSAAVSALATVWGWLQKIRDFFSQVFTLHINVPSLPSPSGILGSIGSGIGGIIPHTAAGGGGSVMSFHFHAAAGSSPAAERAAFDRFARQIGTSISRQQLLLAGGN